MKYFLNTIFKVGDEVYVGMKNAVYKAKIQSIEVHGFLYEDTIIQPRVTYYLDKPRLGSSVNEVAVFATEEDAKLRQKILQEVDIEYFELFFRPYIKDGKVMAKEHKPLSLATDFISLVKRMREAQRNYYKDRPKVGDKVAYQNMINKEQLVDEYLKKMEE